MNRTRIEDWEEEDWEEYEDEQCRCPLCILWRWLAGLWWKIRHPGFFKNKKEKPYDPDAGLTPEQAASLKAALNQSYEDFYKETAKMMFRPGTGKITNIGVDDEPNKN